VATFARPEVCIWYPQSLPLKVPVNPKLVYETDFKARSDLTPFKIAVYTVGGTWRWIGGTSYPLRAGVEGVEEFSYAVSPCRVMHARFFMRCKPVNWNPDKWNYLELDYAWRDIDNFRRAVLTLTASTNNFIVGKRSGGSWIALATGTVPWGATPLGTELEFSGYADGSIHEFTVKRLDTGESLTLSVAEDVEYGYVAMGSVRNYDARFDCLRVERL